MTVKEANPVHLSLTNATHSPSGFQFSSSMWPGRSDCMICPLYVLQWSLLPNIICGNIFRGPDCEDYHEYKRRSKVLHQRKPSITSFKYFHFFQLHDGTGSQSQWEGIISMGSQSRIKINECKASLYTRCNLESPVPNVANAWIQLKVLHLRKHH